MKRLVLGLMLMAAPVGATEIPHAKPMRAAVFTGSATLSPMSSRWYDVRVNATSTASSRLVGRVTASSGAGSAITVAVLTEAAFVNWRSYHEASNLYYSGLVNAADVAVDLRESGNYYVVVSNLSDTRTTVTGPIEMRWIQLPSVAEVAAAEAASKAESMRALQQRMTRTLALSALFGMLGVGGSVWLIAAPKRKDEEPELPRMAA